MFNPSPASVSSAPEWVDDRYLTSTTPIARITWQAWRRTGEGPPFYRVGRRCLYKLAEVQAWLSAGRVAGAAGTV